jgi:hypothetical protein
VKTFIYNIRDMDSITMYDNINRKWVLLPQKLSTPRRDPVAFPMEAPPPAVCRKDNDSARILFGLNLMVNSTGPSSPVFFPLDLFV